MIFGVGFFAVHDMVGKLVVENYPVAQMLAMRSGIALLILLVVTFKPRRAPAASRPRCRHISCGLPRCSGPSSCSSVRWKSCRSPTRRRSRSARRSSCCCCRDRCSASGYRAGAWGAVIVGFIGVLVIVRPGRRREAGGALCGRCEHSLRDRHAHDTASRTHGVGLQHVVLDDRRSVRDRVGDASVRMAPGRTSPLAVAGRAGGSQPAGTARPGSSLLAGTSVGHRTL